MGEYLAQAYAHDNSIFNGLKTMLISFTRCCLFKLYL